MLGKAAEVSASLQCGQGWVKDQTVVNKQRQMFSCQHFVKIMSILGVLALSPCDCDLHVHVASDSDSFPVSLCEVH